MRRTFLWLALALATPLNDAIPGSSFDCAMREFGLNFSVGLAPAVRPHMFDALQLGTQCGMAAVVNNAPLPAASVVPLSPTRTYVVSPGQDIYEALERARSDALVASAHDVPLPAKMLFRGGLHFINTAIELDAPDSNIALPGYGWIGQQSGSGFCDQTPATLGGFCVFGPVLSSPAHGPPSLAMDPI
jgi:hypothetical protein